MPTKRTSEKAKAASSVKTKSASSVKEKTPSSVGSKAVSSAQAKTASSAKAKAASEPKAIEIETESNILKIAEIEESQKSNRSVGEKIAEVIAAFCGSMTFVWVHVAWFGSWIMLNTASPSTQFDPFPFTFLTLVVSLEAIFLSTFILISQNHETRLTERRNHLDLQINMLAEQENTKMLELLQHIAKKVGVPDEDPQVQALLEPVEPGRLVEQILQATDDPREKGRK